MGWAKFLAIFFRKLTRSPCRSVLFAEMMIYRLDVLAGRVQKVVSIKSDIARWHNHANPPPGQGDQIGRIVAYWAMVYFGQISLKK
jgi:hypothetical protein